MSNKYFNFVSNGLKIEVQQDYNTSKFELYSVEVIKTGLKLRLSSYCNDNTALYQYILDKLLKEFNEELTQYIDKHLNDTDFYTSDFFSNIHDINNELPAIEKNYNLSYENIDNGLVTFTINNVICIFDLHLDKFLSYAKYFYVTNNRSEKEKRQVKPLEIFFNQSQLDKYIAVLQYRQGTAHKTYIEVMRLQNFLYGKKSIKIYLKDGKVIEYKHDKLYTSEILKYKDNCYMLKDSYHMTPRYYIENPKDLKEVDYLQHSKTKHYINPENMIIGGTN